MLRQYAREEFVWVPCSDWGWTTLADRQKAAEEERLKAMAPVKVSPQTLKDVEKERERKLRLRREWKKKHYKSRITRTCGCGRGLYANNKYGLCQNCSTKAKRNLQILGERPVCRQCPKVLNRCNKSGLCAKHRAAEWYKARKANAA